MDTPKMDKYAVITEDAIQSRIDALSALGQYLWRHPEVAFAELKAHDYIACYLEGEGFRVTRNYVLPTAFRAEYGDGHVMVALLCEYDALPGLGHACGHNLIAMGSVAAGVAVKEVLRQASLCGKVLILGTPGEEGGAGKVHLLKAGAFDGVSAAMMAHPSTRNAAASATTAVAKYGVTYTGRPAHAAGAPWEGVNAVDAAVAAYVNVAMLRQQLRPDWRVSGLQYSGALVSTPSAASTDVGNVSHVVPTIQPYYALDAATDGGNHTEGFRDASNHPASYDVTFRVAKALALTAVRVLTDTQFLQDIKSELEKSRALSALHNNGSDAVEPLAKL
ncbi:xaa-Arg dipeptidase-like isoform X3 [Haemaphysalis longicornis]